MPTLDKSGEFNSIKISKGVFASLGTVTKITDLSNYPGSNKPLNKRNDGTPFELCIEVEYEREDGEKWNTRFFGEFKKDTISGKVKGWKAFGNGVQNFFETMIGDLESVGNMLNDDYSIGSSLVGACIGKKFYRISYIAGMKDDGKGRWKDFNQIFMEGTTIEQMQEAWAKVASKMKTYLPDVIDEIERMKNEESASFNYGANVEPSADGTEEEFEL